ncbi:A-type_flavoprotein [Hexamita inflata]|uniref:A-type_flavoprotein n=1 Tax=Hexamita inflata TaxID=28002 RepID=A0ABP1H7J7_9EUKA
MSQMCPDIYWTGVIDWSVRHFHGYQTDQGTSYNSYLILDQQPTLIDTVKESFFGEYVQRITKLVPLDQIKYLIVLHAEPDHSSALPLIYPYLSTCTIVCTQKCQQMLKTLYKQMEFARFQIVDARSELNIGKRTMKFVPQPMLHWPEQMWSYSQNDKVLFTSDAFGQHLASTERFGDQLDEQQVVYLQKEYLANILGPYASQIQRACEWVVQNKPKMLLTAHGVSFRKDLDVFTQIYSDYASGLTARNKVVILYESMYGATARAAQALAEGIKSAGLQIEVLDIQVTTLTKLAAAALECCGFCLGSATFNTGPMPDVSKAMGYLAGLGLLRNKPAMTFCAFGWSDCTSKLIELLERNKCDVVFREGTMFKFRATQEKLEEIFERGVQFADKCEWEQE